MSNTFIRSSTSTILLFPIEEEELRKFVEERLPTLKREEIQDFVFRV